MPDQQTGYEAAMAAINPALAASSAITNPLLAHLTNVKNRKFTREMYKTQRQDSLSDWAMQNEYNSPRAQMQRFQEAGLNPHLIYGQQNEGASVRSSSASGGQAQAPQIDTSGLMASYDMKTKSAQADLLSGQIRMQEFQTEKLKAETGAIIASSALTEVQKQKMLQDIGITSELKQYTLAGAAAGVNKTLADTKYTIDQNIRSAELHAGNLTHQQVQIQKDLMSIASMRAQNAQTAAQISEINQKVLLLQKENIIKQFDVELTKKGIRPGDAAYQRWMKEVWDEINLLAEGEAAIEAIRKGKEVRNQKGTPSGKPKYRATDSSQ